MHVNGYVSDRLSEQQLEEYDQKKYVKLLELFYKSKKKSLSFRLVYISTDLA